MWRKRKWTIGIVLAAVVVLVGILGSVAFAQTGTAPASSNTTLLDRVAAILKIDPQTLKNAFTQAQQEQRDAALDNQLKGLVEKGKMTQEQAGQYKAWLQARSDTEPYRQQLKAWQQARPGIPPKLKQWQEARPDMPLPGRFGDHGFRGGMKWGGERYFWGKQLHMSQSGTNNSSDIQNGTSEPDVVPPDYSVKPM